MLEIHRPFPSRWSWLHVSGPDAADFLDRISTADVSSLTAGRGAPGLFLTPQGRIEAWFTLWRIGAEDFALEFDPGREGAWKAGILSFLDKYTFGESYVVADVGAGDDPALRLDCAWIFPAADEIGLSPGSTLATDEEVRLCHHGNAHFGRPWITAWARPARLEQWIERALPGAREAEPEQIEAWRIAAVRPAVDREATHETNPLEIGLYGEVAGKKGCYPGQEVIEKILSRGAPPRRLVRIDGPGLPPVPGNPVTNLAEPPADLGAVTSSARTADGFQALALLPKIHAKPGLEVALKGGSRARIAQVAPDGGS